VIHLAKSIDCSDCEQSFPFSVEQQGLCDELGFEDPRRCPGCHMALDNSRRRERNREVSSAFDFTL
jgi:hypothetical protein